MFMLGWNVWDSVPFGPFTVTQLPSILTSTPAGIFIGFLPILDMLLHLPDYQMNARTSPPMFIFLASRSVITPFEVEMIAVPRPFMTFGSSAALE